MVFNISCAILSFTPSHNNIPSILSVPTKGQLTLHNTILHPFDFRFRIDVAFDVTDFYLCVFPQNEPSFTDHLSTFRTQFYQ
jgi:hypothetical protein